jgi:hypothetical protein
MNFDCMLLRDYNSLFVDAKNMQHPQDEYTAPKVQVV